MKLKNFACSMLVAALIINIGTTSLLAQSSNNATILARTTDQEGNEGILFRSASKPNKVAFKVTLTNGTFKKPRQLSSGGRSGVSFIKYLNGIRGLKDKASFNATRTAATNGNIAAGHSVKGLQDVYIRASHPVIGTDGQERAYSGIFVFEDLEPISHENPKRSMLGVKCSALNMASANVQLKEPKIEYDPVRKEYKISAMTSGTPVISTKARQQLLNACHQTTRPDCESFVDQLLQKQLGNVDKCALRVGFTPRFRGVTQSTALDTYTIAPLDSPIRTDVHPLSSQSPGGRKAEPICGDGKARLTTYKIPASDRLEEHLFKNGDLTVELEPVSEVRGILRSHGQMWDRKDCTDGQSVSVVMTKQSQAE